MEFDITDRRKYNDVACTCEGIGAPSAIVFGLARMTGGELPTSTAITVERDEENETWHAMWLLKSSVAYLGGTKPAGEWNFDRKGTVTGWVRKLSDLTAIAVFDQQAVEDFGDIRLEAVSVLEFGSTTQAIPVVNGNHASFKASNEFAEAVRVAWLAG